MWYNTIEPFYGKFPFWRSFIMKKIIAFSLALTLLGAFTSCGKEEESLSSDSSVASESSEAQTEPEEPTEEPESQTEPDDPSGDFSGILVGTVPSGGEGGSGSDESKAPIGDDSPAKVLHAQFVDIVSDGNSHTTAEIAEALAANEMLPFNTATLEMSEGWINGFTEEISGFKSATFFGPMIGTIPFVGYIFELDKNADAGAFVNDLNEKANLAWNVCTVADEKLCESEGNFVFFIMAPAAFGEDSE